MQTLNKKIGFYGYPAPEVIQEYKLKFPDYEWIDLDIDFNAQDFKILPEAYCKIVKNIINNSLEFKPEFILASVGKEKCDSGMFASKLLKDMGFKVVETKFENINNRKEIKISSSNLPLKQKVTMITDGITTNLQTDNLVQCKPEFGFWGVPPNDLDFLDLFPDTTHVYGWTRCVEAGAPADIDLEMFVDENVPTVFYSQAFCSKCQLAKYLADKYDGLYIDIDDFANTSIMAKTEAFLKLR